ncbi:MAG: hypothetical protein ACJ754_09555 [Pyrinomonadaceae bacterium]
MIERIIQQVVESTSPGAGDSLTNFEIEARRYFGSNEAFLNPTISRTENSLCMFQLRGELASRISSFHQLGGALSEVWQNLAYAHCECSSCEWYKDSAVFRFVTVISGDAFYVTGKITIYGAHYSRLVKKFENNLGRRLAYSSAAV